MKSILIKDVLLNGNKTNILIQGNRFASVNAPSDACADEIIAADGFAILPPFYNTHSHSPMTLLRGYADDMPLKEWLEDHIWPFENQMTEEDIRQGSELAIREMIKSGTVFFSDMYFDVHTTMDVVEKMGVRAELGITFMDNHPKALQDRKRGWVQNWEHRAEGRLQINVAPHSIYTCCKESLIAAFELARKHGRRIQMHLSETKLEIENCLKEHGMRPVHYLDSLGLLGPDLLLAHCVHLDDSEIELLAKKGVAVAHCPCSNMKLGSGIFPYRKMQDMGVRVCIGTDGASSNNALDMGEEMKFAALLSKVNGDVECLPAERAYQWATRNGAEFFGIDAGVIEEGKLADCILVNMNEERMTPCHNLISNMVYAADSSCIDTVICDGRILMRGRKLLV